MRPYTIREVIKNNQVELLRYGAVSVRPILVQRPQGGAVKVQEYWLNEGQAILLFTKMNTGQGKDATFDVISVYMAWRHGHLPQQVDPTPGIVSAVTGAITPLVDSIRELISLHKQQMQPQTPTEFHQHNARQRACHAS